MNCLCCKKDIEPITIYWIHGVATICPNCNGGRQFKSETIKEKPTCDKCSLFIGGCCSVIKCPYEK